METLEVINLTKYYRKVRAVDKVFLSMMEGYSFIDLSIYDYVIIIGNSILYFIIGLLVFDKCVRLAKNKGVLGQY